MSYAQYLRSEHWLKLRARYRASRRLPQKCLGCGNPRFELHHRSYQRVGHELLTDLVPLCRACHQKVHDIEATSRWPIQATHSILRSIFGWTKGQTKKKFSPWRQPGRPNGFSLTPKPGRKPMP
jgi:5-methylcytosine-specific restriction endonuclease McrA